MSTLRVKGKTILNGSGNEKRFVLFGICGSYEMNEIQALVSISKPF